MVGLGGGRGVRGACRARGRVGRPVAAFAMWLGGCDRGRGASGLAGLFACGALGLALRCGFRGGLLLRVRAGLDALLFLPLVQRRRDGVFAGLLFVPDFADFGVAGLF